MGAYKRTPVAAVEREAEVPPLDLHVKAQNTQWAESTSTNKVTDNINNALEQVWRAATRKNTASQVRRPRPAGPRPKTNVDDIWKQSNAIKEKSIIRIGQA